METFIPRPRSRGKADQRSCLAVSESADRSEDSVPSVVFPSTRRSRRDRVCRPVDTDLRFEITNLYIFFSVVIQILTGFGVLILGIVFITLNYRHGLLGDVQVNLSVYLLEISALLFFACAYATSLNYNYDPTPNQKHLNTTIIISCINISVLLTVVAWGWKTSDDLGKKTISEMDNYLRTYYRSEESLNFINNMQSRFNCCGVNSYGDWEMLSLRLPASCCSRFGLDGTCLQWKEKGCYQIYYAKMFSFVHYVVGFGSVSLGVVALSLIPTVITLHLTKRERKLKEAYIHLESSLNPQPNRLYDKSMETLNIVPGSASISDSDSDNDALINAQLKAKQIL